MTGQHLLVLVERNKAGKPSNTIYSTHTNSSAVDALQALLLRGGSQDVLRCVEQEGGWELLRTSARHEDGVAQLAR